MTAAALALEILFVAVAFVGRMVIQRMRTGDAGFRLGSVMSSAARLSTVLMTFGSGAGAVATALVTFGWSRAHRVPSGVRPAGLVLLAAGVAIAVVAQFAMGRSWRIGVDDREVTELVTTGPFRVVRNPIFSAMVLASVGLSLAVPTALTIVAAVAVLIGVETQARFVEEPYLLRSHGEAYAAYGAAVGRFIPAIGRSRRADPSGEPST